MKTFEEAVTESSAQIRRGGDVQVALKAAFDRAAKYTATLDEIHDSDLAIGIVESIRVLKTGRSQDCECDICEEQRDAMLTAFVNGVRIGMEMERQELPEG